MPRDEHANPVIQATYDPVERRMVVYVIGDGGARKVNAEVFGGLQEAMNGVAIACGMAGLLGPSTKTKADHEPR